MAADITTLADDVVAALNAKLPDWGYSANAERVSVPTFTLENLDSVKFSVVAMATTRTTGGKGGSLFNLRPVVGIEIRKRTGNTLAANDALVDVADRVADYFLSNVAAGLTNIDEAVTTSVFTTNDMKEQGVFACGVELTFDYSRALR
jgi:hypothetical protein